MTSELEIRQSSRGTDTAPLEERHRYFWSKPEDGYVFKNRFSQISQRKSREH